MLRLDSINPTIFLVHAPSGFRQLVRCRITNDSGTTKADIKVRRAAAGGPVEETHGVEVKAGTFSYDIFVPDRNKPERTIFELISSAGRVGVQDVELGVPVRWAVHLVQSSHHDFGYTNLPSTVAREHAEFLRDALAYARDTDGYPSDARFRIVIEQAWSLLEFLRTADGSSVTAMKRLLQTGRFELTALFGNMTTELCGPELLYRALYPSARIARGLGVQLTSAEHNDIPGVSWGLAQVLTDAGIPFFCPHFPYYHTWGDLSFPSFWDQESIFDHGGPGAFLWEAPSGRTVLVWSNNGMCASGTNGALPGLEPTLESLARAGYPYRSIRWTVRGGMRDNSPYTAAYCDTVESWNSRWAYPRLINSTNAGFYGDLLKDIPETLPVLRGELPGQDYPVGAASTAADTAVNRNNHVMLPVAEKLSTAAATTTDHVYDGAALDSAYDDVLRHDLHAWGFHFPAGPAAEAARHEKSVFCYRAAAAAHDLAVRAGARIADQIAPPSVARAAGVAGAAGSAGAVRLVVFNMRLHDRGGVVRVPLRELENCGSTMVRRRDAASGGYVMRGVPLTDRWHVNPGMEFVTGAFRLIDEAAGEELPFQIASVGDPSAPVAYAPDRVGLGTGTSRYGMFEQPDGLRRDLVFVANAVPGCGYKSYLLVPVTAAAENAAAESAAGPQLHPAIENDSLRIELDGDGRVRSLLDKRRGLDWVDSSCPYSLLDVVVRSPTDPGTVHRSVVRDVKVVIGPVFSTVTMTGDVYGHPAFHSSITIYEHDERVDFAVRLLKDQTPLLDVFVCFPFIGCGASFAYEGVLSRVRPPHDFLPGAFSDDLGVQNWVSAISKGGRQVIWASQDAPVVQLGGLHRGNVSQAHRAVIGKDDMHEPAGPGEYDRGWIFSHIFANNFGTNFYPTQPGDALFRYSCRMLSGKGHAEGPGRSPSQGIGTIREEPAWGHRSSFCGASNGEPIDVVRTGGDLVEPFVPIFATTEAAGAAGRNLSPADTFLTVDPEGLVLLAWKRSDDNTGHVLRFWNASDDEYIGMLRLPGRHLERAFEISADETERISTLPVTEDGRTEIRVGPFAVLTVLIPDAPATSRTRFAAGDGRAGLTGRAT